MRLLAVTAAVVAAATIMPLSGAVQAGTVVVYVDDSADAGGDGSAGSPVQTIQAGIALLPVKGGIVAIHPGIYLGPIRVDRDDVILWGLTNPVYDAEGFLAGFTSDDPGDDAVVITIDVPRDEGDPAPIDPVDLLALHGDRNEVHNVVIDSSGISPGSSIFAFSAEARDDEFYDDIVFSHIIVRGVSEITGFSAKADPLFEYVTSLDPGFAGIWADANGHVEMRRLHVARKSANVVFTALEEQPKADNGPSFLTGVLEDSLLERANGFEGFFNEGIGLLVLGRKNAVNQAEPVTILIEAAGNVFQDNARGVAVWAVHGPNGFSTEPTLLGLDFHDNAYVDNHQFDVDVNFRAPAWAGNYYAANTWIIVADSDGAFPDPADVDPGPAESGNEYELIGP